MAKDNYSEIRIGREALIIVDALDDECLVVRNTGEAQLACRKYGGYSWPSRSGKTCFLSLPEREHIYHILASSSVCGSIEYVECGAYTGEIIHCRDAGNPLDGLGVIWHGRGFAVCSAATLVDYAKAALRSTFAHKADRLDISLGRVLFRAFGEWKETTASVRLPVLVARDDDGDHAYLRETIDRHPAFAAELMRLLITRNRGEIAFEGYPSPPLSWLESSLLVPQRCVGGDDGTAERMLRDTGFVVGRDSCIYQPLWRRLPSPIVAMWTFEQFSAMITRMQMDEVDDDDIEWFRAQLGRTGARVNGSTLVLARECRRATKERWFEYVRATLLRRTYDRPLMIDPQWKAMQYKIDFGTGGEPTVQVEEVLTASK